MHTDMAASLTSSAGNYHAVLEESCDPTIREHSHPDILLQSVPPLMSFPVMPTQPVTASPLCCHPTPPSSCAGVLYWQLRGSLTATSLTVSWLRINKPISGQWGKVCPLLACVCGTERGEGLTLGCRDGGRTQPLLGCCQE